MTSGSKGDTRIVSSITRLSNPRVAGSSPAAPTNPKKPVKNERLARTVQLQASDFYLKAALNNQVRKVEAIPPNKQNWREYERLRELVERLRRNAGSAWWVPVLFAAALVTLVLLWLAHVTQNTFYFAWPDRYLRVVQNLDPCLSDGSCGYRFVMQAVVDGVPAEETQMHFCKGLQPRFEQGHTLRYIGYANLGTCLAIEKYDVVRRDGFATLAPNCRVDYSQAKEAGHVVCEGGRARF